jgi:branched-chain amino acid transport system ATP-binding protein
MNRASTDSAVLRLENVTMQFGGVVSVNNFSMEVRKGEIVSLIGPNGAGKTTAFNVITGVYAPTNGAVYFKDKEIIENYPKGKMVKLYASENKGMYTKLIKKLPDQVTKLGVARTFQHKAV